MTVHVFGIRHHGPGSARSLRAALHELRPDCLLVEGPPEAEPVLDLLTHAEMRPPVALLVYVPEEPRRAVYYPLVEFSPEWQAIHYGLTNGLPVRLMDLPQAHALAAPSIEAAAPSSGAPPPDSPATPAPAAESDGPVLAPDLIRRDPLRWLAEAAGDGDGERWWERMVEQRRDRAGLFAAIMAAMTALREAAPAPDDPREQQREAFMRQTIRAARREGRERIAVVCGAWHAPALADLPPARQDAALLKGLPKIKVEATWVPWTEERLATGGGYGAGVESPAWYGHLWLSPDGAAARWLTRAARLLRREDLPASSADVIEAVRLAETLAALRGRPAPGLTELNEAALATLCHGDPAPLRLIHQHLVVGDRLGAVPETTPRPPLQADLAREQRRLRLPPEATQRTLDLDLRGATDLERSRLLHRLSLLEVRWGLPQTRDGARGTFHEVWLLQWRPELAVALIEAGRWGNTILTAATARARADAATATDLAALTALVERLLLADLPAAVAPVLERLQAAAALAGDVGLLMAALPPLVTVCRYGDVRGHGAGLVRPVIDGLVARICIGLPGACAALDDDAAAEMDGRLLTVHLALATLNDPKHRVAWEAVLRRLVDQGGVHGRLAGHCCRLLLDAGGLDAAEAARRLRLALSTAVEPARAAAWLEGFLSGGGLLLLHDAALWSVLDEWVTGLADDTFTALLPLLRRTFAAFTPVERRQMGERVAAGPAHTAVAEEGDFDLERADAVLPIVARLLGLQTG